MIGKYPGALLTWFVVMSTAVTVWAHGGGPELNYDPCAQWVESENYLHFAAYQPEFNRFAEYCRTLPRAGETLLVFDLVGAGLMADSISIELEREGGPKQLSIPSRRYPSGVITLSVPLQAGRYHAVLIIGRAPDVHRVDFDFRVGAWWGGLLAPFLIIGFVFAAALAYCLHQGRKLVSEGPLQGARRDLV
jgi:hypothetical protein